MPTTYHIYTDGGARGNPGPSAIGVLVCDKEGNPLQEHSDFIGISTNNVAEYCALIAGMELAKRLKGTNLHFFLDSELVCRQMSGEYRIKSPEMIELYKTVKAQAAAFKSVSYTHVPRTHPAIRRVDKLLNRRLDQEVIGLYRGESGSHG